MLEPMYEFDPTVRVFLDEVSPEDRANGAAVVLLGAVAIFGVAWLAKELAPALARLAAQLPPAGAVLERAAAMGLLVAVAMAPAPETHR